jgi:hypothetical protein
VPSERYLEELRRESGDESLTRLSSLNPSLLQDLLRFEQNGRRTELLEVIAACRAPFAPAGDLPAERRTRPSADGVPDRAPGALPVADARVPERCGCPR